MSVILHLATINTRVDASKGQAQPKIAAAPFLLLEAWFWVHHFTTGFDWGSIQKSLQSWQGDRRNVKRCASRPFAQAALGGAGGASSSLGGARHHGLPGLSKAKSEYIYIYKYTYVCFPVGPPSKNHPKGGYPTQKRKREGIVSPALCFHTSNYLL